MRRGCAAVLRRALSSASSRPPRPPVSTSLAALPAAPPLPAPAPEMITPLLDRMDGMTTIVGYDRWGFNVSNVHMRGSVLVLPNFTLLWDVRSVVDISPRSVAPLFMLTPKPEMLLIGAGLGAALHVNPALYTFLSRKGISLEVMSLVRVGAALAMRAPTALLAPSQSTHFLPCQHSTDPPPLVSFTRPS